MRIWSIDISHRWNSSTSWIMTSAPPPKPLPLPYPGRVIDRRFPRRFETVSEVDRGQFYKPQWYAASPFLPARERWVDLWLRDRAISGACARLLSLLREREHTPAGSLSLGSSGAASCLNKFATKGTASPSVETSASPLSWFTLLCRPIRTGSARSPQEFSDDPLYFRTPP